MQWPPDLPPKAEMDKLLQQTKMQVFMHKGAGWHGSLMAEHEFIWSFDCPTAWCSGEVIGFNPYLFFKLNEQNRVTLMVHEVRHTAHDHFTRFRDLPDQNHDEWNIAGDFIINNDLDDMGFDFDDLRAAGYPPCLDHTYDGMTTEQVYNARKQNPNSPPPPQGWEGDLKPNKGDPNKDVTGSGAKGQTKAITPEQAQAQKIQTMHKLVRARIASQMAGDEPGTIPGEIELMIENFLYPKLPWEVILARWFTDLSNDDYSYRRPNRRYEDEILPSLMGENGLEHLMYFWDVSGSVTDEQIAQQNAECKKIHDDICPEQMTVVTFDTKIRDIYEFAKDDDFKKIKVIGRGGTNLKPVHDLIKERRPTAAVIFTDLYCAPMQDPGIPIVWVVIDNPNKNPDFGKVIHMD